MNNSPRAVSKTVMALATLLCIAAPADACGMSIGTGGWVLIVGLLGLALAGPATLAAAGLVSAVRARRTGLTALRASVGALAVLCELGVARVAGPTSLLGVLAVGVGALQLALFALAAVNGPDTAPLGGRLTVLRPLGL